MDIKHKIAYGITIFVVISAAVIYFSPARFLQGYGHSMEPVIKSGDGIIVVPVKKEEISIGDTIAFKSGGVIIAHKVVGFEDGKIITHGVNLPKDDVEKIDPSQVIGKRVLTIPKAGIIIRYVGTRIGFILLILIPASLIIVNEVRKIKKELEKENYTDSKTEIIHTGLRNSDQSKDGL
ncbi:hypothetical protein AKJ40_04985 [candidate division MSBL1 archaeon SCGC-AAA259M10]|uniref:Uncharacterized protein n=1 Tax=candidate division MSBL1 archaeon SCGC-AAA259M10 TaxID=1698270 RepID=A0A133UUV6_9EURY|nr:hypothetical protein AKJ40_04985 [candidate division MSBL1 archaeon SCGC-AAA259M10]